MLHCSKNSIFLIISYCAAKVTSSVSVHYFSNYFTYNVISCAALLFIIVLLLYYCIIVQYVNVLC